VRVIQLLLRYETLSRFRRLRKSEMYSRRNKDSREVVPLVGVITHIAPASREEKFRLFKLVWRTKGLVAIVSLTWGSRNIVGISTVKPKGLNVARSLRTGTYIRKYIGVLKH